MPIVEPQPKQLVWPWPVDGRAPLLADWLRLIGHPGVEQRQHDSRNSERKPVRVYCHCDK